MHRFRKLAARRCGLTLLELLIVLTILVALSTLIVPTMGYLGRRSQRLAARENLYRLQNLIVNRYWNDMGDLPRPTLDLDGQVLEPDRLDHPQLRYLFVNPDRAADPDDPFFFDKSPNMLSGRAWQGPYISHTGARYAVNPTLGFDMLYGLDGDPVVLDAWGRPIVLQLPTEVPVGLNPGDDQLQILRIQRLHARLVSAGPNGRIDTPLELLMPPAVDRGDDIVVFLFRHDEEGEGLLTLEDD